MASGGCGDEDPATVMTPMDLPSGVVELTGGEGDGPSPLGVDGDYPDGLGPSEPTDRYETAYAEFLAALEREIGERCNCQFAELGHGSAAECFQARRKPDFVQSCELTAFQMASIELGPRYSCFAGARDASASCIEEGGCGALSACELARDQVRPSCGPLVFADAGFLDFTASCERSMRLGTPSGCPDVVSLGSALGAKVFEGTTTGAGDDITLSCHGDWDDYESADVTFEWQAPAAGRYRFGSDNSAFATQMGVLDGCGGTELACASSSGTTFGGASVTLSLEAMQRVVVVLEGYGVTQSGYYALSVTEVP